MQVIRRIAERGLKQAQELNHSRFIDMWQHILDEINRDKMEEDNKWKMRYFGHTNLCEVEQKCFDKLLFPKICNIRSKT